MHKLQMYENLRDMLEREVTEIEKKNDLDEQSLDHLYKLMATLKNTDKCIEREKGGDSYGRSYNMRGMSRGYMPYYDMRDRDNDGRYNESRDNFRGDSYRGRSNESGRSYDYSRDSRPKMMDRLQMLMDEATNENERQAIMDAMNRM